MDIENRIESENGCVARKFPSRNPKCYDKIALFMNTALKYICALNFPIKVGLIIIRKCVATWQWMVRKFQRSVR